MVSKSTRVILPFFVSKDIKPVSFLLSPKDLVVCLSIICIMAQISDNLKGILSFRDIQKMPSVKIYSKILSTGISSLSLSSVFAISKTLGPELESLSLLSLSERIIFLRSLYTSVIYQKVPSRLSNSSRIFVDPFELLMYRKGLALQCRSVFSATSIFLPHSLVIGIPIKNVGIELIVESARYLWTSWGLEDSEFDFFLLKDAWNYFLNYPKSNCLAKPNDIYESCKILVFSEFCKIFDVDTEVFFDKDPFVFKSIDNGQNLTTLEKEFGFFHRTFPIVTPEVFISDSLLKDDILRLALDQRKTYNSKIIKSCFL